MPGVEGFEQRELIEVFEHEFAETEQHSGALPAVGAAPDAGLERASGGADGEVDIRVACRADGGDQAAVARGDRVEGGTVERRPKLAVDEQAGLGSERGRAICPVGHIVYLFTASQSIVAPSPALDGTTRQPASSMSIGWRKKSRRSGVHPGGS